MASMSASKGQCGRCGRDNNQSERATKHQDLTLQNQITYKHQLMADSSSASYIHMVQHLIEKCLIFRMTKEECMDALFKHANISPVITSTVWTELEKENKEFFETYAESQSNKDRMSEDETSQMIQRMILDSSKGDPKN
ncbi:hypothetical protein SDJN03_07579, partial [Cucurbita argyrosperma subsp. sororia]